MKIQLDTTNKTIKIDENILLSKLVETLESLLPNKEWKKYTLETNTVIQHFSHPYIIEKYVQPYVPYRPWQPWITYSSLNVNQSRGENQQTAEYKVKDGLYNLQIKA